MSCNSECQSVTSERDDACESEYKRSEEEPERRANAVELDCVNKSGGREAVAIQHVDVAVLNPKQPNDSPDHCGRRHRVLARPGDEWTRTSVGTFGVLD